MLFTLIYNCTHINKLHIKNPKTYKFQKCLSNFAVCNAVTQSFEKLLLEAKNLFNIRKYENYAFGWKNAWMLPELFEISKMKSSKIVYFNVNS